MSSSAISTNKKIDLLIQLYKEAEQNLIKTIALKEIKGNQVTFYKEMLEQVQREILRLQIYSTEWATDITKQLYEEAYKEAINILELNNNDSLTKLHKEAIEIIATNLVDNLNSASSLVGRQIEDIIREIGLSSVANKFAVGNTIKQLQKELAKRLISEGLTGIKDKLGRTISISAYAEMVARSTVAETQNTCVKNVMKEHNKELVKMTSHFGCCPVCAVYEGRVYSMTGQDDRFPSLKDLPGFREGYNNLHPRCRHRIVPYVEKYNDVEKDIKNSNRPFEVDKEKEDNINKYYEEQKKKAKLRSDRKQYEKYKQILSDKSPKNFQSFRKIKYNNSKRWKELKKEYVLMKNSSSLQERLDYTWEEINEFIPTNTIIQNVKIIAGSGSNSELRSSEWLTETFGGNPESWSKKVGKIESEKYIFDVHWNELNGSQYLMKVKNRKEKK